jgi:hypothetical protein
MISTNTSTHLSSNEKKSLNNTQYIIDITTNNDKLYISTSSVGGQ